MTRYDRLVYHRRHQAKGFKNTALKPDMESINAFAANLMA
jgi:hypothetical protein